MRKDCFERTHQFKEALLQREGWGGERKALPECRKIMFNYATHELNRTVLIKKGKTCSLTDGSIQSSLRKRGLMPSPRCWRNRRRCGAPGSSPGSSLHFAASAERIQCRAGGGLLAFGGKYLTHFLLSPFPPQTIPPFHQHYLQTMLQKPGFYISFFLFFLFKGEI